MPIHSSYRFPILNKYVSLINIYRHPIHHTINSLKINMVINDLPYNQWFTPRCKIHTFRSPSYHHCPYFHHHMILWFWCEHYYILLQHDKCRTWNMTSGNNTTTSTGGTWTCWGPATVWSPVAPRLEQDKHHPVTSRIQRVLLLGPFIL